MSQPNVTLQTRRTMNPNNPFKIGLFASNSNRVVSTVPERWVGTWDNCLALAKMAEDYGVDYMLPLSRWKGYGGKANYQGSTLDPMSWTSAVLAITRKMTVFTTIPAPMFNPLLAAKAFATADQIGHGRFGLNIVCGWNEDEFDMLGVTLEDHKTRYEQSQEWLDIVLRAWSDNDPFDYDGTFYKVKRGESAPKPFGGSRPLLMNAGSSPVGREFAVRNCDAIFLNVDMKDVSKTAASVKILKQQAADAGKSLDCFTVGFVICRPTTKEAQDYYKHVFVDCVDEETVNLMLRGGTSAEMADKREVVLRGGGPMIVGDPDHVAGELEQLARAGVNSMGFSFVNFLNDLPIFGEEVMPRLRARLAS